MTHPEVRSHAPQGTGLLAILLRYYPAWLAHRDAIRRPVLPLVRREFERFFQCGDPDYGYAVVGCDACGFSYAFASSCKGRAWCPYCLSRRQAAGAAHLVDGVFAGLPVRHWVHCLPPHLRYTLGYDAAMLSASVSAFTRSIFRYLRRKAKRELKLKSVDLARAGAISFIHRCSANLDTNVHFHALVPDGVFIRRGSGGSVEFHPLSAPTDEEIEWVAWRTCELVCKALAKGGFWQPSSAPARADRIEGLLTFGDRKAKSATFFAQAARHGEGGVSPRDGAYAFHVNADHLVEAGDRRALVELVEYVLAPPLSDAQVFMREGRVVIAMKRHRRNGAGEEVVDPFTLLDRLAALVPRRRSHGTRYHGAYGPNADGREDIMPWRPTAAGAGAGGSEDAVALRDRQVEAAFQARHHPPDVLVCPHCAMKLTIAEVVTPRLRYRKAAWLPPDEQPAQRVQDRGEVEPVACLREGQIENRCLYGL